MDHVTVDLADLRFATRLADLEAEHVVGPPIREGVPRERTEGYHADRAIVLEASTKYERATPSRILLR
ncbi:MAG: hypothetical protein ACYC4P_00255 [Thermoanaerobaculia bacterium]